MTLDGSYQGDLEGQWQGDNGWSYQGDLEGQWQGDIGWFLSTNGAGLTGYLSEENNYLYPQLHPCPTIKSRWITDLNVESKLIKFVFVSVFNLIGSYICICEFLLSVFFGFILLFFI